MKNFRCWKLRASLVDFAEGRLEEKTREQIEHHVASCADCATTVLSLREVPAELRRRAAPERGEQLWASQRAGIMRTIGDAGLARPRQGRSFRDLPDTVPWVPIAALAASVAMIVLAPQWWARPRSPQPDAASAPADSVVASTTESFADDLFETDEASLAMAEPDDLDDLGDFFEDAAI
jgi:anti-sigma factor RsiW